MSRRSESGPDADPMSIARLVIEGRLHENALGPEIAVRDSEGGGATRVKPVKGPKVLKLVTQE